MTGNHHPRWLLPAIIAATLLGLSAGWLFGAPMEKIDWIGTLFLNALKMIVIPLIFFSLLTGIVRLGSLREVGSTGVWTLVYYFCTTAVSVLIGLVLVNLIRPGAGVVLQEGLAVPATEPVSWVALILSLVPPNIVEAMAKMDVLGVIVFALLFGIAVLGMGEKAKPFINICEIINDAIIRLVHILLYFVPLGIFALVAAKMGAAGGGEAFWVELRKIGSYCAVVLLGLALHAFLVLPALLFFLGKRDPLRYGARMLEALFTAFSTASSSATLPITMDCVETRNKVSPKSANFVLPLGATINMDGTALYEAVAAMFIAQSYGIDLSISQQAVIFFTAMLASVGAAGIPQAGLVTMVLVLNAVGLPTEGIAMILAVDWFLDRFRTAVNVWGDAVGAAVIERTLPKATRPEPVEG